MSWCDAGGDVVFALRWRKQYGVLMGTVGPDVSLRQQFTHVVRSNLAISSTRRHDEEVTTITNATPQILNSIVIDLQHK